MDTWSIGKNKPNSNPIQTQFKPNQSQNKAKTNPNKPNPPALKPRRFEALPANNRGPETESKDVSWLWEGRYQNGVYGPGNVCQWNAGVADNGGNGPKNFRNEWMVIDI
ncbi:MAG: hypothetical protein ACYSUY_04505 [Planctomycetota bacterium]